TGQLNSLNKKKKNSIVQFKNAAETVKPRKKAETRIDLNVVYESRPDIGKPIKYNLFCNDLKNKKNIKLLFSFNELMMFSQSASSENINLITKKNKSKDFIFNIKTGDKNLKVSFNAGNIGELRASVLVFEDSNNNNSPDQREIFNRQDINQTIGLED
ncbi:hypothetical protein KA977_10730, partial [Candidatus Dependentiae bacterium]|nr:hypothetical protein [Candidatus Dependentiae bacterium]